MTTYLVFSINRNRGKEVSMNIFETLDEENVDPYEQAAKTIVPPYLGECIVVKQDDVRRFKLRSHVVEVK